MVDFFLIVHVGEEFQIVCIDLNFSGLWSIKFMHDILDNLLGQIGELSPDQLYQLSTNLLLFG